MGICKDLQGFTRLWERIHKDSWGFLRICKILGEDFHTGFTRICKTLGEDLWGFARICKDSQDFGRGFIRIYGDS